LRRYRKRRMRSAAVIADPVRGLPRVRSGPFLPIY